MAESQTPAECSAAEGNGTEAERAAAPRLAAAVEETMLRLRGRFQGMSQQLESQHEMGTRIHGLEKNVSQLITQAGMEEQAASK